MLIKANLLRSTLVINCNAEAMTFIYIIYLTMGHGGKKTPITKSLKDKLLEQQIWQTAVHVGFSCGHKLHSMFKADFYLLS